MNVSDRALLSATEAAEYLGFSDKTLYRLVEKESAIPQPVYLPGCPHMKWKRADLEKFVESLGSVPPKKSVKGEHNNE